MAGIAIAFALALVSSGCAVGPDFVRPVPADPPDYTPEPHADLLSAGEGGESQRLVGAETLAADWWQIFRSQALARLIEDALRDSPNLAEARANLAQAQALVDAARGALFPRLDFVAGISRSRTATGRSNTSSLYSVGPALGYTPDVFGGIRRGIEQQAALAELQARELAAAWLALTGNAVAGAITLATLDDQLDATEALIAQDRENLDLVQRKYDAGKAPRSDVLIAQTQLATDQALLPPLEQQRATTRHALAALVGRLPGEYAPPDFVLDDFALPETLPLTLPSSLARQRPDILAAEAELHAASAAIGVATAQLYPTLTLSADLTREGIVSGGAGTAWSLAAQLAAPVFRGGTLRAQRRAAVEAYQAALARYRETVLTGFQQVADTLRALENDASLLGAQADRLAVAGESLELQRLSYAAGKSSVLNLVAAQRAYQQARIGFVQARGQRLRDGAGLFVALGGGWWKESL